MFAIAAYWYPKRQRPRPRVALRRLVMQRSHAVEPSGRRAGRHSTIGKVQARVGRSGLRRRGMRAILTAGVFVLLTATTVFGQEAQKHATTKPVVAEIINAQGHTVGTATLSEAPNGVKIRFDSRFAAGTASDAHTRICRMRAARLQVGELLALINGRGARRAPVVRACLAGDIPELCVDGWRGWHGTHQRGGSQCDVRDGQQFCVQ